MEMSMELSVTNIYTLTLLGSLIGCCGCFYARVLLDEWLSSKPWDSVSARKIMLTFNVKDSMSDFKIQQTLSLKKTKHKQLST